MEQNSVTTWIEQAKAGNSVAAQRLWERYLVRLVRLAQAQLIGTPQQVADADDVCIVAFERFLRYAQQGKFPRLDDRHELWQVLVMVTEQVAIDQKRKLMAMKRGNRVTRSLTAQVAEGDTSESSWQPAASDPTPDFAAAAAEQCERLLNLLDEEPLRQIAVAKLHGFTNEEIASQLDISLRGVERKLKIIRKLWSKEST